MPKLLEFMNIWRKRKLTLFDWIVLFCLGSLCSTVLQPFGWGKERRSEWCFLLCTVYNILVLENHVVLLHCLMCIFILFILLLQDCLCYSWRDSKMDGSIWTSKTTGANYCKIITRCNFNTRIHTCAQFFYSFHKYYLHIFLNCHNQAEYELSQSSTRNRLSVEDEYVITLLISKYFEDVTCGISLSVYPINSIH